MCQEIVVYVLSLCGAIGETNWCHAGRYGKCVNTAARLAADEFHHSNLALEGEFFVTKCADKQSLQFWQCKVAR